MTTPRALHLRLVAYLATLDQDPLTPTNAELAAGLGVASSRSGSIRRALHLAVAAGLVEVDYHIDHGGHCGRSLRLTAPGRRIGQQLCAGGGA